MGGHARTVRQISRAVAIREVKEEGRNFRCAPGVRGIFLYGIFDGRRTCEAGKICIRPSAFDRDVSGRKQIQKTQVFVKEDENSGVGRVYAGGSP